MSVGEEITECPLCMEMLEMDDINFFPCTCGYQICRFCWHRIRTDENGLCPACRKQYPEDPAQFKPLTEDDLSCRLSRIKKERRQKDLQRKQKAAENRKHLANVRVVQRNLVFVVGLSQRLADPEVLKKNEYFGKFGKIHKVVINHSTSYAGAQSSSQGPSASAYVTYQRPEDTLRAIQAVNNIHVDGRTLKASLGTTKYCSHFLRGSQCPKPDCMYLHELGEESASFTKEEMQQGKHQEYEQKLYEQFMNSQNITNNQSLTVTQIPKSQTRKKTSSPENTDAGSQSSELYETPEGTPPSVCDVWPSSSSAVTPPPNSSCTESWPSLQLSGSPSSASPEPAVMSATSSSSLIGRTGSEHLTNSSKNHCTAGNGSCSKQDTQNAQNRAPGHHRNTQHNSNNTSESYQTSNSNGSTPHSATTIAGKRGITTVNSTIHELEPAAARGSNTLAGSASPTQEIQSTHHHHSNNIAASLSSRTSSLYNTNDSMSLFSSGNGFTSTRQHKPPQTANHLTDAISTAEIPETIPVASSTDWQAAFGFTPSSITTATMQSTECHDDDLGFDPWDESSKALADLIEKEGNIKQMDGHYRLMGANHSYPPPPGLQQHKALPPGLSQPNHTIHGAFNANMPPNTGFTGSKIMGLMQIQQGNMVLPPNSSTPPMGLNAGHHANTYHADILNDVPLPNKEQHSIQHINSQTSDVYNMKDWQEGLRALLPNINIHFGTPPYGSSNSNSAQQPTAGPHTSHPPPHNGGEWLTDGVDVGSLQYQHAQSHPSHSRHHTAVSHSAPPHQPQGAVRLGGCNSTQHVSDWDPAIVTQVPGQHTLGAHLDPLHMAPGLPLPTQLQAMATNNTAVVDDQTPHWMASLQNLTDETSQSQHQTHAASVANNHSRLPFVQQFPTFNSGMNWAAQTQQPPPGFQSSQLRQHTQHAAPSAEAQSHQLEAGVQ